jgi:hypothetical protein
VFQWQRLNPDTVEIRLRVAEGTDFQTPVRLVDGRFDGTARVVIDSTGRSLEIGISGKRIGRSNIAPCVQAAAEEFPLR